MLQSVKKPCCCKKLDTAATSKPPLRRKGATANGVSWTQCNREFTNQIFNAVEIGIYGLTQVCYIITLCLMAALAIFWSLLPGGRQGKYNDYNAALIGLMRVVLAEPWAYPFCIDPQEAIFGTALLPKHYYLIVLATNLLRPTKLLHERPWLGYMAARTRTIDSMLSSAVIKHRVRQVVILGAGHDTRAARFSDMLIQNNVKVYEVDQPHVQERKRRLLKKYLPAQLLEKSQRAVVYAACNFESATSIECALKPVGFDPSFPTIFLWEGVVWYLTASAVTQTLESISNLMRTMPHAVLVVEGPSKRHIEKPKPGIRTTIIISWAKAFRRPFTFGFPDRGAPMQEFMRSHGLRIIHDYSLPEMYNREFGDKVDASAIDESEVFGMRVVMGGKILLPPEKALPLNSSSPPSNSQETQMRSETSPNEKIEGNAQPSVAAAETPNE